MQTNWFADLMNVEIHLPFDYGSIITLDQRKQIYIHGYDDLNIH